MNPLRWIYWYPFHAVVRHLPIPVIWRLGDVLGTIRSVVRPGECSELEDEIVRLGNGYSAAHCRSSARDAMHLAMKNGLEVFLYPRFTAEQTQRVINTEGTKYLDDALQGGRGVILLLAHFGQNQLCMPALGHLGYPINQIGATPDDWNRLTGHQADRQEERIFRIRFELEKHLPAHYLYIQKSMRPVVDRLADNEVVIMAFDGRAGTQFIQVPFFSHTLNISSGPFSLARMSNAPILPLFMVRQSNNRHRCILEPPLQFDPGSDRHAFQQNAAIAFIHYLQQYVGQWPEHYIGLLREARRRAVMDTVPLFTDSEV